MPPRTTPEPQRPPAPHEAATSTASPEDLGQLTRMHMAARQALSALPKGPLLVADLGRGGSPVSIERSFASLLTDDPRSVLLGHLGDVPVGYGVLVREGTRGRVVELWVDAEARSVGVGSALLEALREEAARRGMTGLDAIVLPGDRNSKNFFEDHSMPARAIIVGTSGT